MNVETRKVVVLDYADYIEAKSALNAALSVRNKEVKSDEIGDRYMDSIIRFLNTITNNFE